MSAVDGPSGQVSIPALATGSGLPRTPPRPIVTLKTSEGSDELLIRCAKTFSQHQTTATPIAPRISRTRLDPQVPEQKNILSVELGPPIELSEKAGRSFASSLYPHLATNEKIDEFLDSADVYQKNRWALPLPHKKLKENDLYQPLVTLLNAIIQYFRQSGDSLGTREVIDTSKQNFSHKEPVPTANMSRPDISVKAEGPSFQLPPAPKQVGYSNIIAFFEVKLSKGWSPKEELLQMAIYVRQLFIQQPNRRFVRALVITECNFRLFHFDRSGVQFTQPIGLHGAKGCRIFIRLVLGLSLYEADAGLDTTIQWEIVNGVKVSGTLTANCAPEKDKKEECTTITYDLASIEPVVLCYNIRGRGIVCWTVVDPDSGKTLLVRDVWRSADRLSEDIFLGRARTISGMVTMISYECSRERTKDFRDFIASSLHESFRDRIATRLIVDTDGRSIKNFKSVMELLCALRDAIAAHKELYMKKTLHRDITLDNILLGKPGAVKGERGMLMGLDLAIFLKRNVLEACKDWKTTTGIYQSAIVLENGRLRYPIAHDHMDDLESFCYVLTQIIYTYDPTGDERSPFNLLIEWELKDNSNEADSKVSYLSRDVVEVESGVEEIWPQSCTHLLIEFKGFLKEIHQEKRRLANLAPDARKAALKKLVRKADEHYKFVLGIFDKAIEKVESGTDGIAQPYEPDLDAESSSIEDMSSSPGRFVQAEPDESPFDADSEEPPFHAGSEDSPFDADADEAHADPGTLDENLPVAEVAPEGTRNFYKRLREASPDGQPVAKRGPQAAVTEAAPQAQAPRSRRRRKAKSRGRR
ncbi:hypothetical protein MD484_g7248, partial [Candolleomyces efflorescens]